MGSSGANDSESAGPPRGRPDPRVQSASLLAAGPLLDNAPPFFDIADTAGAAAKAREIAERMPLPPGESLKLEQLDWSRMGGVSSGDIEFMLQYRASCTWYRHVRGGGLTPEAAQIIGEIASWPAFRGADNSAGETARRIAADLARGDETLLRTHVRANCGPRPHAG
jgi:hypothetical protein